MATDTVPAIETRGNFVSGGHPRSPQSLGAALKMPCNSMRSILPKHQPKYLILLEIRASLGSATISMA
jgi:hypothetical protein